MWVNGVPIPEIAALGEFKKEKDVINKCNQLIYNISTNGSWGMDAMTQLLVDKEDIETLDIRESTKIRAIAAMVYFGVDTLEGVAMRNLGVSRVIAKNMGKIYREHVNEEVPSILNARSWLKEQEISTWNTAVPADSPLTGEGYQTVWKIIEGSY